ncbi:MAG: hypothetical protein WCF23_19620 [Candidatus Nitrosopolaris sp.]
MNYNKSILYQRLKWMAIYVAIALAISFIVPFPFSFIAIMGTILFVSYYVRRRQFGRIGLSGSSKFGGIGNQSSSDSSLNYYCMNCGTKHNRAACPKCGSKMKRVGS